MEEYIISILPGNHAIGTAIASFPRDESIHVRLLLAPGRYEEKIELCRSNVTIEGVLPENTIISWHEIAAEMLPDGFKRGTFRTATFRTDGTNITLKNLTIENTASPCSPSGQAVALYADGDFFACENCILRSYQDTLFTAPLPPKEIEPNGFIGPKQFAPRTPQRHTYRNCRISGDIDFIFGGAAAWFESCDIISLNRNVDHYIPFRSFCTAASTPKGQKFGYVFHACRFLSEECPPRSVYLGRPWREYAKTVLLNCELDAHICAEGFDDWGKSAFHDLGFYAEYNSTGAGTSLFRASYVHLLSEAEAAAYTYETFIHSMDR